MGFYDANIVYKREIFLRKYFLFVCAESYNQKSIFKHALA